MTLELRPVRAVWGHHWPSGQIVGSRLDTNVSLIADHRCACAVRRCALQPIACCRPFFCRVQGGVSHPIVKKPGLDITDILFVLTYFEPVGVVEATRTPRCSPAEGLFNVR